MVPEGQYGKPGFASPLITRETSFVDAPRVTEVGVYFGCSASGSEENTGCVVSGTGVYAGRIVSEGRINGGCVVSEPGANDAHSGPEKSP